jgi:hypothetical protein
MWQKLLKKAMTQKGVFANDDDDDDAILEKVCLFTFTQLIFFGLENRN